MATIQRRMLLSVAQWLPGSFMLWLACALAAVADNAGAGADSA